MRGTGLRGEAGILRIDFPDYVAEDRLDEISWEQWFAKFDESELALLVQDEKESGEPSTFNRLVSRETAGGERA